MDRGLPVIDPGPLPEGDVDGAVAEEKFSALKRSLSDKVTDGALVAFSGGMDSAFLLWAASEVSAQVGGRVVALTTTSPSTPSRDRKDALEFTERLEIQHVWEESLEMELQAYSLNDRERCYHCKTELFRIAGLTQAKSGLRWVLYGYNASDRGDDRPGHRAALEAGALTPLADADLSKAEIDFLMKENGLPLSGKPASPCLSSRVMTGIEITPERLADVEGLEEILRSAGANTVRVRVCREEDASFFLRVEASPEDMNVVLSCREELQAEGVRRGYRWVTLDLGGYRTGGGVS